MVRRRLNSLMKNIDEAFFRLFSIEKLLPSDANRNILFPLIKSFLQLVSKNGNVDGLNFFLSQLSSCVSALVGTLIYGINNLDNDSSPCPSLTSYLSFIRFPANLFSARCFFVNELNSRCTDSSQISQRFIVARSLNYF
jgi:hypothetical protein